MEILAAIIAADQSHMRRLEEAKNKYRETVGLVAVAFEQACRVRKVGAS
jgi:hypothetical protein